jgi:hypothetical protein
MIEPTVAEPWQTPSPGASVPRLRHRAGWGKWSERVLLVTLILIFVVTGFIPAWRHLNSDFPNYYLIARLYREGYPLERVYEWTWLQRQKDHRGIDQPLVSFIPSTLPSALVVLPLSSLPPLQAKRWWLGINLVFLLLIAGLLRSITELSSVRIALLMFLAIVPLRDSFLYGQMHILVLLLLTIAACLYFKDYLFFSGFVIAIAATMKIYPALFLVFLVFKKQWRAAVGVVVGLAGSAVLSLYLFGGDAYLAFVQEVLPRGLRGETIDPYSVAWNSLSALLRRLFIAEPELNPAPVVHAPALYAFLHPLIHGFIFVAFMWVVGTKTEKCGRRKLEWAAYLFMLFLLSSQPGPYHFVALILTAVLVIDYLVSRQQIVKAGLVVVLYVLICCPLVRLPQISALGWSNLFFFPRLALMMVLGGVLLWILISASPESPGGRFNSRTSMLAAFALAALVGGGFISNMRHFKGQFDNYKTRLVTIPDSLFASEPVATSRGVLFTAMGTKGYMIRALRDGSVRDIPAIRDDWFHPAAGVQGNESWAEQSSGQGSRIVRFLAEDSTRKPTPLSIQAENAQQPVVSSDGQLLAFIREENGRDSLWVQPIKTTEDNFQGCGSREIAGTGYDVREMSFDSDHRLVFSSRSNGRFTLYMEEPQGNIEEMRSPSCSARYPAISPDGKWMAFSCEQAGSWQIHVMDLRTSEDSQLTNSECNSTSPAWTPDSKRVVYATDCGRGLGLTALAELTVFH